MRADLGQLKLENSRTRKEEVEKLLIFRAIHVTRRKEGGEGHEKGRGKHSLFWYREGRKPLDVTPAKPL